MNNINLYNYGRQTVQGPWNIGKHRVVNRLYYVNSGTAVISNAHREYTLVAGMIYIIPQCDGFRPIAAEQFDHTYFDFYTSQILRYDTILSFDAQAIGAEPFFRYINSLIARKPRPHHAMESFLCGFLSVLEHIQPFPYISNAAITHAVNLIHQEYASLSTKQLAERLALDKSYFIRLFSSVMGITPMKYIRACRVSYGRQLLRGGATVAEAAEKCGYASPSAFYNAVSAELNVSPSALRK